ncbi:hypothetical protein FPS14_contig00008-0040 [Flavobacterium psychrophilum]|nr:hypothetical protein FPS14_contig00008-0040 [Flavobacterium psychrophilum]
MKTKIIIAAITLLLGVTTNAQETTVLTKEQIKLVHQKDSLINIQAKKEEIQAEIQAEKEREKEKNVPKKNQKTE